MITIELVKVGGYLVGRTVSDRWNLETLGYGPIRADRNQSVIKRMRREYAGWFTFVVVRNAVPVALPDQNEYHELGQVNSLSLEFHYDPAAAL